jgi:hypothetical protein
MAVEDNMAMDVDLGIAGALPRFLEKMHCVNLLAVRSFRKELWPV